MIRVDETDPVGEVEPSFPYRDVTIRRGVDFKNYYDIQSEIGRGKFGTVYQCKEKTSGLLLAAKVVTTTRKEDRRSVEREVEIMRRLQHPRLIQLYDAIDTGKQIYVILELIQGGELFERVIDDDFVLTERSCAVFMRQICEGIEFMHAQHILHLDMKPENILCLTKEGNRIKIIDFGLARHYDPRKKMQVLFGTPEFVAPEVVNFDQIGFGTDMWSIGVICYVLLSGLSPFMGDTDVETMANVTIAKYDFDHDAFADISEDAKDFVRCLLVKDKEMRRTASECRSHRWLAPKKSPVPRKTSSKLTKRNETKPVASKDKPDIRTSSSSKDELDVTKDNLRLFVERWREHPNSPYSLDTETRSEGDRRDGCATTMPTIDSNNLESISLRGQSPSPCGSVCSASSDISDANAEETNYMLAVLPNSMMQGLERRASEGNYANSQHHRRRDQAAQIVLAEEIIKLSEHLRNLTTGQLPARDSPTDEVAVTAAAAAAAVAATSDKSKKKGLEENKCRIDLDNGTRNAKADKSRDRLLENGDKKESNEISEKLSTMTRRRKTNGTTFNGIRSYEKSDSNSVTSFSLGKTFNNWPKPNESRTLPPSNDKIMIPDDGKSAIPGRVTWRIESGEEEDREIDLIPPWRQQRRRRHRSRTIHRFGETCRDVPRISNLRDIHKNLNLDEPQSTKDLLLHLLGEWDDASRPGDIGRKSVSVDWGSEESVARRSINSLADYFQSERQKTAQSSVIANDPTATSSVHR